MHELTALRKRYVDADTKVNALEQAGKARKDEARQLKTQLEAAALSNQVERARELMDDLAAMDEAYRQIAGEYEAAVSERDSVYGDILLYYQNAQNGGPAKVDWSVEVFFKEKGLWSDWGGHATDGNICVIDKELCEPEQRALAELFPNHRVYLVSGQNEEGTPCYRLQVKYNQYRGTTWGDLDGQKIVESIVCLLPAADIATEVTQFLKGLEVVTA